MLKASAVGNIRVLEPAEVGRLVGPNRALPAIIGLVLGSLGAIALTLIRYGYHYGANNYRYTSKS